MRTKCRKTLVVLLTLTMLLSGFTGLAVPASAVFLEESGQLGDDVYYTYDADTGAVSITGTGGMWTFYDSEDGYISPFHNKSMIRSVTIGEGVTDVTEGMFWYCDELSSVTLPEGLTAIGTDAFSQTAIRELTLPASLREIGDQAFRCSELTSIVIPDGVTDLGGGVFTGCEYLTTAAIPGSVGAIRGRCFNDCPQLKKVYIGKGLESFGPGAFSYSDSLTDVYYAGSAADWAAVSIDPTGHDALLNATVHYNVPTPTAPLHAYGEPVWSWEKDHSSATATFTCAACGDPQTVTDNAPVFENGQFTATVELQNTPYTDTVPWRTGDLITFGGYPQSRVTDTDTEAALTTECGKLSATDWQSYGYYTGNGETVWDGQMKPGDWMKYADLLYNGERYRAVWFSQYRPDETNDPAGDYYSWQDDNGYRTGTVYFFKFESLQWRVLDPAAGLVLCENVIDAQAFQNVVYQSGSDFYQGIGSSDYANNYATSSIRDWLRNDFYNTAFSKTEQTLIASVWLNDCGVTDKVFLLSASEARNTAYGFPYADECTDDPARIARGTDYAKCQGLRIAFYTSNDFWWLRTPELNSFNVDVVDDFGWFNFGHVDYASNGVRPAFRFASGLTVSSNPNGYCEAGEPVVTVTPATCGADGETKTTVTCTIHGETLSETTEPIPATGAHTYGSPVWSWEKCHGKATATFTCAGCGGETQTVTDNAPAFENGQFTAAVEFDGTPYTNTVSLGTGDLVEFGSYPQSEVTDETLKTTLNSQTLNWTSYKYYFNGTQDDFMQYADVTVDGNRYRAVRFSHYRPYYTTNASTDADNAWQDENNYSPDTVYWFEYEPIVWRILDADAGLMLTESIVDSQPFCNGFYYSGGEYYGDADHTHYASDWADSSLREWLNGDFLNAAFDSGAQSHIKNTSLVTPSSNSSVYDAGPTTDKIFVLSKDDVLNTAYGFISGTDGVESANRTAFGTDYAKCQGLLVEDSPGDYFSGASWWRLRSPYLSYGAGDVGHDGHVNDYIETDYTDEGVRPAVKINLQSAIAQSAVRIHHDCGGLIPEVPATCTENGAIDHYVCSLCGRYLDADRNPVDDIEILAAGHTYGDTGDDRFTCTVCGHVDDDLKAAAELADAKATLSDAIGTAREYYDSIKDDYPVIADDLDTKLQQAEGVLGNDAATIDEINTMTELAGTALDAAKDARKAADMAAFEEYRETLAALADGMKLEGDSDACIALIGAAKEAVDAVVYDESKTLDENKEALDAAAALTQLAADLADQRAAEADDPKEVFEEYRATLLTLADALRRDGDSEAVTALIDEAVAALTGYVYDDAKTLAENEDALSEVLALFANRIKSQRRAERQAELNKQPCSLCGEHHTGSLLENFIGVIHGIIWIMTCVALIAV